MAKVLDEITRISRLGCIDDRGEIAEILGRMSRLTVGELCAMVDDDVGRYVRYTAEAYLHSEHGFYVEEGMVENLGFPELLCLVDNTKLKGTDSQAQEKTSVSQPYRYVGLWNIFNLFEEARKNNSLIRMFMALEVHELMGYLDVRDFYKHERRICKEPFQEVRKRFPGYLRTLGIEWTPVPSDTRKQCVEDLLTQAGKVRRTAWNPWNSVETYKNQVLAASELVGVLLIDCFKYAYPNRFCLEEILMKYGEYGYDFEEDIMEDFEDIEE